MEKLLHLVGDLFECYFLFPFVMCGVWLLEHVIRFIAQISLFRA